MLLGGFVLLAHDAQGDIDGFEGLGFDLYSTCMNYLGTADTHSWSEAFQFLPPSLYGIAERYKLAAAPDESPRFRDKSVRRFDGQHVPGNDAMMSSIGTLSEVFDPFLNAFQEDKDVQNYIEEMSQFFRKPISTLPPNFILLAINREGDCNYRKVDQACAREDGTILGTRYRPKSNFP